MGVMRGLLCAVLTVGSSMGCRPTIDQPSAPASTNAPPRATTDLEELHAFTRLYGYVRFFHPSDAAAAADWEWLAVEGVRRLEDVEDQDELVLALESVFHPIAPTVIVHRGDVPPPEMAASDAQGPQVAWQHRGSGFGAIRSVYDSARTNRSREVVSGGGWAPLVHSVDAVALRGKRVRLTARVRVQARSGEDRGALWVRVDRKKGAGAFENMNDRPIRSADWEEAVIELPVADDATSIVFGGIAAGQGRVDFDDFALSMVEGDVVTPVEFPNPSFEAGDDPIGWSADAPGFSFEVVSEGGGRIMRISRKTESASGALFDAVPEAGEVLDLELGAGLRVRLPVVLPDAAAKASDSPSRHPSTVRPGAEDPAVRVAAIVVGWNVLQHFYPYFDVIDEDWEQVLDESLEDVLDDADAEDLQATLERMVSKLHDGHGRVTGPLPPAGRIPVPLARVEDQIVVTAVPEGSALQPGDRVLSIDGVPIEERLAEGATRASGSPHYVEHLLLGRAGVTRGPEGSVAAVEIERDGVTSVLELSRTTDRGPRPFEHPPIERLDDGVFYVDLDVASWEQIQERLDEIAAAPGVVFDLRGYPNSNHQILAHLLREPDDAKWMFVPEMIYPDQRRRTGWEDAGWEMVPAEPHITGRVAFITGPMAISYAESVMGYVEGYQLGEIVGSATAGANGNVNPFVVPGGFRIMYTGMKVTRMDGRQHHGIGILPTVPAAATRAGVKAGRDELLETALSIVRAK